MVGPRMGKMAGVLAAVLAAAGAARAQEDPHIGYVYPAGVGGRLGGEIEVTVGGQYLGGVTGALISGTGIQVMVTGYYRPMTEQEQSSLRQRRLEILMRQQAELEELQKSKPRDAASMLKALGRQFGAEEMEDAPMKAAGDGAAPRPAKKSPGAAKKAGKSPVKKTGKVLPGGEKILDESDRRVSAAAKRQPNPQLAESVRLYLTVSPEAPAGIRELRLKTAHGVSNPLIFVVGKSEEHNEREPNDKRPDTVTNWLPVVINGQIMPGDVDRFRFRARKGMHLVAAVNARSLIPYLADAVPGWFQATLALFDARGNQLVYADDFRFDPDPVIYYEVPQTGDYILEIKDAIFRGREDFVYRLTVGQVPFITGIFPLGGPVGAKSAVQPAGWNLLSDRVTLDGTGSQAGIFTMESCWDHRLVKPVPYALGDLPECLEKEPNNERRTAQRVELPVIINGRIDRPGDWDAFSFAGRAGEQIVAEVHARRLGSPLDSLLELTDAGGKLLAANDDHEDPAAGLTTHHADSRVDFKLPSDGAYLLRLGDTQHKGGPEYAYRLRIARPRPDFELRVAPSSVNAAPGATVPISVFALRKDGFAGDISLRLRESTLGFHISGAWIPAGQDKSRLTLTVPAVGHKEPVDLHLEGRATIDGKEVRRAAAPAEDMMQAFAYRHLVPAERWLASVAPSRRARSGYAVAAVPFRLRDRAVLKVPVGGTAPVHFSAPSRTSLAQVTLELNDPPDGIIVRKVSAGTGELTALLAAEEGKAKCGLKGNLLADAVRETFLRDPNGNPTQNKRRTPLGMVPAVAFEVVPGAATAPASPAGAAAPAKP